MSSDAPEWSSTSEPVQRSSAWCFGGSVCKWTHWSGVNACPMTFSVFLPPQALKDNAKQCVPVVYFLSGLTCNEDNFMQKAGAQRVASELGLALVCPDTSTRVELEGDNDSWDFGRGAGFYVNATEPQWSKHYNMYSYVVSELPTIIGNLFPALDTKRASIMGHSMGGHGALICALKNPGMYQSVSAFAPICHPVACPWGVKAFTGYLGSDQSTWSAWDATELVSTLTPDQADAFHVLVDQGKADNFYPHQLLPADFVAACDSAPSEGPHVQLRYHDEADHGYYFVATFVEDHLKHHAAALGKH